MDTTLGSLVTVVELYDLEGEIRYIFTAKWTYSNNFLIPCKTVWVRVFINFKKLFVKMVEIENVVGKSFSSRFILTWENNFQEDWNYKLGLKNWLRTLEMTNFWSLRLKLSYQKILWDCSLGWKNLLEFSCHTTQFSKLSSW